MAHDSEFQPLVIPAFGGGLNISQNPAFIQDHEWSWSQNVFAKNGAAECARSFERVIATIDGTLSSPIGHGIFPNPADPTEIFVCLSSVVNGSRDFGFHLYKINAQDPGGVGVVEVTPTDIVSFYSAGPAKSAVLNGKHMVLTGLRVDGRCVGGLLEVNDSANTYTVVATDGDKIARGDFEIYFEGSGLDDMTTNGTTGTYTGTTGTCYTVEIDATGTPDTFKWKKRDGSWTTGVAITGAAQTLEYGIEITFAATTGHTLADQWMFLVGKSLAGKFMVSFGGYLIIAHCDRSSLSNWNTHRTVAWSASNDPLTWEPSVANAADDVILDDSESPITGMAELAGNRVGIYTDKRIYTLTPTSRIPAFTRSTLQPRFGATPGSRRNSASYGYEPVLLQETPDGILVSAKDGIVLTSGGERLSVDSKVHEYIYRKFTVGSSLPLDASIWHQEQRQALIPISTNKILCLETTSGAWSRMTPPDLASGFDSPSSLDYIADVPGETGKISEIWILDNNTLYREQDDDTAPPQNACFLDTKDFHVGIDVIEFDGIFLDWEGLCDGITNRIEILHDGREDFATDTVAELDRRTDPGVGFSSIGILSQGQSYLSCLLSARFHRFRIRNYQGRFRLRGMVLSVRRGSDK